jgi:hypothetical protein
VIPRETQTRSAMNNRRVIMTGIRFVNNCSSREILRVGSETVREIC